MSTKRIMKAFLLADKRGMTEEEWLELRKRGVCGSDAGTICGLNPFSSLLALYAEKKGIMQQKEDNEAMRIGRDLEEYVAKRFLEEMCQRGTPKRVKNCNYVLQHPNYPWMLANVDRLIIGENAGLECKTTSAFNKTDFVGNDIPPAHYCQCQHYMAVTGADRWYLEEVVLGKGAYSFVIERNEEDIKHLIELEQEFWVNHIEKGIPPETDGSETSGNALSEMYPVSDDENEIDLTPFGNELRQISEINAQIKEYESQKEKIEQRIKEYMGENGRGFSEGYQVSWKSETRNNIDSTRLRKEHPEIAEAYTKTTNYRKFIIKEI